MFWAVDSIKTRFGQWIPQRPILGSGFHKDPFWAVDSHHSTFTEWVCAKTVRPDGTLTRDCMSMYTGGEPFDVCFANTNEGKKCLCSSELCNGSEVGHKVAKKSVFLSVLLSLLIFL